MVSAAYEVVRAEEQTPDLWAGLVGVAALVVPTLAGASNAGFSSEEISHITKMLEDLRSEVQQLGLLSSAQFEALSAALSEQVEAANRLGRKDWASTREGGCAKANLFLVEGLWVLANSYPAAFESFVPIAKNRCHRCSVESHPLEPHFLSVA